MLKKTDPILKGLKGHKIFLLGLETVLTLKKKDGFNSTI